MPFVVDASISASWFLPDEARSRPAEAAFSALDRDRAIVPTVWWFEIRNTLIVSERRKRISRRQSDMALSVLARCPIDIDGLPEERRVLDLARRHGLTIYDASYLELAARLGCPLATNDAALAAAARADRLELMR